MKGGGRLHEDDRLPQPRSRRRRGRRKERPRIRRTSHGRRGRRLGRRGPRHPGGRGRRCRRGRPLLLTVSEQPGLELLPPLLGQPFRDGLVQPRQLPLDLGEVGDVLPVGEVSLPVAAGQPHEELDPRVARRVLKGEIQ